MTRLSSVGKTDVSVSMNERRPEGTASRGRGEVTRETRRTTLVTTGTLVDTGDVTVSVVAVVSVVTDAPPGALVLAGAEVGVVLVDADVVRGLVVPVVSLSDAVMLFEPAVVVVDVPVVVVEEEGEEEVVDVVSVVVVDDVTVVVDVDEVVA